MKWRIKYIVIFASGLVLLAMESLWRLFPYLLREHALKVDSAYFIIACVVCGTMPLTIALLYTIHRYLRQLKDKKQTEANKLPDSDLLSS